MAVRIKQAREYRDITQVKMAQHLNLARQTYLDIESGKTEPKVSSVVKIAEITGRPLNWLVYGETSCNDIAFAYRYEFNHLFMLFNELPLSARELIMQQAHLLAEYTIDINSNIPIPNKLENAGRRQVSESP